MSDASTSTKSPSDPYYRSTKSGPPNKKARLLHPSQYAASNQASAVSHLFDRQLDKPIHIPTSATKPLKTTASLAPPPEIVANVQGSSAGAGSGEFHVYKASRRREYERVRLMEEEAEREDKDKEWKERIEEKAKKDAKKSRGAKRRELKAKKGKGGHSEERMEVDRTKDLTVGRPVVPATEGEDDMEEVGEVEQGNGLVITED